MEGILWVLALYAATGLTAVSWLAAGIFWLIGEGEAARVAMYVSGGLTVVTGAAWVWLANR